MRYFLTFTFFLISVLAYSNNIQVNNVNILEKNQTSGYIRLQFDISWENSWRISNAPANYDAAWIFVKYRIGDGNWQHASLNSNEGVHTAPAGSIITSVSDGSGVFMYRSSLGSGAVDWKGAVIQWQYADDGVANDAPVRIQVFAIEMVYVGSGAFYVGDGDGVKQSLGSFYRNTAQYAHLYEGMVPGLRCEVNNYDDEVLENGIGIHVLEGLDTDNDGVIDLPHYPTGYKPFYCMKYEISQQQYVDFLNTLTRQQQQNRTAADISGSLVERYFVMSNSSNPTFRNGIACYFEVDETEPIKFYNDLNNNLIGNELNDGQHVANNYMNWTDAAAYADWAGLRPMTELEFEKIAKGTEIPVYQVYAWGDATLFNAAYTFLDLGTEVELAFPMENIGNALYSGTMGSLGGPLRCGAFAQNQTGRLESGASYYGVMDISGNVLEQCVSLGHPAGRAYTGTHGDGKLNTDGYATNPDWPGFVTNGVTAAGGSGTRGGHWWSSAAEIAVAYRFHASRGVTQRDQSTGFRAVRTVQ